MFRRWANKIMTKKYKRYKKLTEATDFVYDTNVNEYIALYEELRDLDPEIQRLESESS